MDRGAGTRPPEVKSFYRGDGHPLNSPDSGKKRKLEYEQLGLPISKHKFRDRCKSPGQGSPGRTFAEAEESSEESTGFCRTNRELDDGPDPSEVSSRDSRCFVAVDDGLTALDSEMPPEGELVPHCGPWTSSGGSGDGSFWKNLYSLDSRVVVIDADPRDPHMPPPHEGYSDLEDEIQEEPPEHGGAMDDQLPSRGDYGDYIEECPDAAIEDLMLYSNDLAPNACAHRSGGWEFEQDAGVGSRKPTIDQEFEQYFSMLML